MIRIQLLLLSFLLTANSFGHKFYVSIADLNYNAGKNRIEGSLKLTAHDFEEVLENKFNRQIHMEEVKDSSTVGLYMQTYLRDHFKVYSDGELLRPTYLGKEVSLRQNLFFYFTLEEVPDPKKIEIVNTLLFEYFPEQQNIVHYKYQQRTKSVTLVPSKNREKINFDD